MTACYLCKDPADFLVEEVWFDLGEANMRLASTEDWTDKPSLCRACKPGKAHVIANVVASIQGEAKAFGPFAPKRWWVRFSDGHIVGGDCAAPAH